MYICIYIYNIYAEKGVVLRLVECKIPSWCVCVPVRENGLTKEVVFGVVSNWHKGQFKSARFLLMVCIMCIYICIHVYMYIYNIYTEKGVVLRLVECKIPGWGQILISGIKKGLKRPFKQIRPPREALLGLLAGSLSVSLPVGRENRGPLCGAAGGPQN